MDCQKCNGWTNHATWLFNNHFGDDEHLTNELPSNFDSVYDYMKAIKDYTEEIVSQFNECSNGFLSDMLSSALSDINYHEISEDYYKEYLENLVSLELLDTCYPDYFQGSSHPIIAVTAYKEQTFYKLQEDLKDSLESDCTVWDLELSNGKPLHSVDSDFLIESFINNLRKENPKRKRLNIPYVESMETSECYHYIAVVIKD